MGSDYRIGVCKVSVASNTFPKLSKSSGAITNNDHFTNSNLLEQLYLIAELRANCFLTYLHQPREPSNNSVISANTSVDDRQEAPCRLYYKFEEVFAILLLFD